MKKILLLIVMVSILPTSLAAAEIMQTFKSGSRLQLECAGLNAPLKSETKVMLDATCLNYIKGAFDLHQTLVGSGIIEPRFCKPADADLGQLARAVIAYIEKNQDKAEVTASSLIMHALSERFPCSKKDSQE
jgi:hypothetical protein